MDNKVETKTMKLRNIKLTVGTRLKPKKQRPENVGAKSTSPARRSAANGRALAAAGKPSVSPEIPPNSRLVFFELFAPDAHAVSLAGSFNQWNPSGTPMTRSGEGKWIKDLYLVSGRYEYLFVVDGRWTPDLKATEEMPNRFGGCNSVVEVSRSL